MLNETNSYDMWKPAHIGPHILVRHSSYVIYVSSKWWDLDLSSSNTCPSLHLVIRNSHCRLSQRRGTTNHCSYSLDSSKRPRTEASRVNAILLAHHHLNFRLISLLFKKLNAIDCTHWIPIGYRIPDGYGHGYQFMPMGTETGGYRRFLWVWVWAEEGRIRPYPTHSHP